MLILFLNFLICGETLGRSVARVSSSADKACGLSPLGYTPLLYIATSRPLHLSIRLSVKMRHQVSPIPQWITSGLGVAYTHRALLNSSRNASEKFLARRNRFHFSGLTRDKTFTLALHDFSIMKKSDPPGRATGEDAREEKVRERRRSKGCSKKLAGSPRILPAAFSTNEYIYYERLYPRVIAA